MARVSLPSSLNCGNHQGKDPGGPDRDGTVTSKLSNPRNLAADRTDLDERLMQFGHPEPRIGSLHSVRGKVYRLRQHRQVTPGRRAAPSERLMPSIALIDSANLTGLPRGTNVAGRHYIDSDFGNRKE